MLKIWRRWAQWFEQWEWRRSTSHTRCTSAAAQVRPHLKHHVMHASQRHQRFRRGSATLQDYGFPCTSQSHTTSACFALQSWHKRERSKGVSARWTCQRRRLSFVSKKFWTLGNAPHSKWLPSSLFEVPWAVTRPATRGGNRAIDTPEILCNVFSC